MNNKQKLIWKYFWEQKAVELVKALGYILISPFLLIYWVTITLEEIFINWWDYCYDDLEGLIIKGFIYGVFGGLITIAFIDIASEFDEITLLAVWGSLIVSFFLLSILFWWLQNNWDKAKARVEEELKTKRKKKK